MNEAVRKAREIALKLSGAPSMPQQRAPKCATSTNAMPLGKRKLPSESIGEGAAGSEPKKSRSGENALFFESLGAGCAINC